MKTQKELEQRRDVIATLLEDDNLKHDEFEALEYEMYQVTIKLHQNDPDFLTEDYFDENFTPIENQLVTDASYNGCMFETYGEELEYVKRVAQQSNRVWTLIEGDYGTQMITAGFHFVNRMGYLITEEEYPSEASYVIVE